MIDANAIATEDDLEPVRMALAEVGITNRVYLDEAGVPCIASRGDTEAIKGWHRALQVVGRTPCCLPCMILGNGINGSPDCEHEGLCDT